MTALLERETVLKNDARRELHAALTAGLSIPEAVSAVVHGWNEQAIQEHWSDQARANMTGWLIDLFASDFADWMEEQ